MLSDISSSIHSSEKRTSRQIVEWVGIILILLPLLWFNVRSSQHWGDDFAVYVQQAINISEGKTFDSISYDYVPGFCSIIPSAPVGFSLLLLPVYRCFGLSMYAFSFYLSAIYVLWAMLTYFFCRKHFSALTCCILLVVAFYPNFMLWLKLLITSDVPFALWLFAGSWFVANKASKSLGWSIAAALLFGLAIVTRTVGIVVVPALAANFAWQKFFGSRKGISMADLMPVKNLLALMLVPIVIYICFNYLLFPPQYRYESYSFEIFDITKLPVTLVANAKAHGLNYMKLFRSTDPALANTGIVFSWSVLLLTITGFVLKFTRQNSFYEWVVLMYLALILIYPVQADYRYIAPVHPFLIFYLFWSLREVALLLKINRSFLKPAIAVLFLLTYYDHLQYLWHNTPETVPGPYEKDSQETFSYMKNEFPENEKVVFNKPRALALFTGKHSTYFNCDSPAVYNLTKLKQQGVKFYLYSNQLAENDYKSILDLNADNMIEVYKNWQFTLYKDTSVLKY